MNWDKSWNETHWQDTDCIMGKRYYARYYWARKRGQIPKGLECCHYCDAPYCVNIDHCWIGTKSENRLDSVAKGRWTGTTGFPSPNKGKAFSEEHKQAISKGQAARWERRG